MASALDTARQGIEARLKANWFRTPIAWPGVEFDAGEDDWIRLTILTNAGRLSSGTSGGHGTVDGLVLFDLFTVTKRGYGTLYGYMDELRDLYDRATVGSVEFLAASGPRELVDEVWAGIQFEVPFIIEETS